MNKIEALYDRLMAVTDRHLKYTLTHNYNTEYIKGERNCTEKKFGINFESINNPIIKFKQLKLIKRNMR